MRKKSIHLRLTEKEYDQLGFLTDQEKRKPCNALRYIISALAIQNGYSNKATQQTESVVLECATDDEASQEFWVTITEEEHQALTVFAEEHFFPSPAACLKSLLLREITNPNPKLVPDLEELKKNRDKISEFGIRLNQIARRINSEDDMPSPEEMQEIQSGLTRIKEEIGPELMDFLEKATSRHSV